MSHFVYMLRCQGSRIYTGYAVDVAARFDQHRNGKGAKFTKAFPPECILRYFILEEKGSALRLEARIKKMPRPQKDLLAQGCRKILEMLSEELGFAITDGGNDPSEKSDGPS